MKRRFRHFLDSWNFTPTERTAVLTLAGAFLLGVGVRIFQSGAAPSSAGFDYAALDAEFAQRSAGASGLNAPGEFDTPRVPGAAAARADSAASLPAGRAHGRARPSGGVFRVELNRASRSDLMRLPGIGEVIADRIIRYREEHGAFGRVSDLLKVGGIGARKLEKIAPHCYVGN